MTLGRKFVIGIGVVVALGAAAYTIRVDLLISAIGYMARNARDIGENQPVVWARGDAPTGLAGRPNVIVILTDDMGFNDVSTYGGGMIETPNIDALAKQGMLFENGYAGSSVCAPSRAMIMTGRYSTRFGFEFTPTPDAMGTILEILSDTDERPHKLHFHELEETHQLPYEQRGMPAEEITIAEYLQGAGYQTLHIGKWHLGRAPQFVPRAQGFAESLFMTSGLYLPVDSPDVVNSKQPFDFIDRVLWNILTYAASFNDGPAFEPDGYLTDYYTQEAVKAIEANAKRPFFLYLAHWGIHTPLQAKKSDYDALAAEIPDHRKRVYAAMIRAVDRSVGDIVATLKRLGIEDNTMIVFTSDNGGADYVGLPDLNKPYRGWKLTFFEGGTHVPYIISWPGKIPAGARFNHPVSHLDILPTALAAAGVSTAGQGLDGVNLLPHLSGANDSPPHDVIFWREGHYQAVLADGWKLQVSKRPDVTRLYNLRADPSEWRDLASANPDKVAKLKALLAAHNAEQAKPMWPSEVEMPIWVDKTLADPLTPEDDYIYWPN